MDVPVLNICVKLSFYICVAGLSHGQLGHLRCLDAWRRYSTAHQRCLHEHAGTLPTGAVVLQAAPLTLGQSHTHHTRL